MIEGQNGLNWPRWTRLVRAVEDLGFVGLYRSDHFTNNSPPDLDSLELWISLAWLASHTQRIEFGSLVTPLSFRHPVHTARMAAAIDDLSHGRLTLGLGAGWQEREHKNYGFALLDIQNRFARFEEGLEIISSLLKSKQPVIYSGDYYQLNDAVLLPPPRRPEGPPLLIGGNGQTRTLPLAARFADEWNAVYLNQAAFSKLTTLLDDLAQEQGRAPTDIRRSMMVGCIFGKNDDQVNHKVSQRASGKFSANELRQRGLVVGTASQIVDQLSALDGVGLQRVMLQWLDLDDINGLEAMAQGLLPHFPSKM
ncbi:MAG: TIGR03560 family F420-dependent LLM class oxidoreductase [Anaerolineales bacterium]|nr:TIGR03560 family F420-dependent LLM class oxidoreductase [Anaerolineales bacterium]